MDIKQWLKRIRAISTPFGGIELGDPEQRVSSQSEALRRLVCHLLWLKEVAESLEKKSSSATELIKGIDSLSSYLRIHHALLPDGEWKENIPRSINEIVALQRRIQSGEISGSDVIAETRRCFENFLNVVDATLKDLASKDA